MVGLDDYILGGLLLVGILNGVTIMVTLAVSAKVGRQLRLTEFIHSRAMKAKKIEDHKEKVEEQRVSKLRKSGIVMNKKSK